MHTMKSIVAALGLGALLFSGPVTECATYYVDSSWTGAPSGTISAPFTNLAAAAVAYTNGSGHTVMVARGLYKSVADGGAETFGPNGYNLAAKAGTWKGGYAGWQGETFNWTEAGRTFPNADAIDSATMTVINLTNANSRAFVSTGSDHVLTFDGFVFRDSNVTQPTYDGGALYLNGSMSSAVLYNCLFLNNRTTRDGGGAWFGGRYSLSINVVCVGNAATNGSGGGLHVSAGNTGQNFLNCRFFANAAKNGGGMGTGGSQTFVLTRCTFENNTAVLYGGAVGVGQKSTINGVMSRFTGNSAGRGNAIGNVDTYSGIGINLENCLVAGNIGTGTGYALYSSGGSDNASVITLRHTTVVSNTLGGVYLYYGRKNERAVFQMDNSIVAFNGVTGLYCSFPVGSLTQWGDARPRINNSIVYGQTSDIVWAGEAATTYVATNLATIDPSFTDLNGSNFRPAKGSPAIDAGLNLGLTADLDGVARPTRFGYDLGCYEEFQFPILSPRAPVAQPTEAEVRAEFVFESTNIATVAWFVLDTSDKGTNSLGDWDRSTAAAEQAQGAIFGSTISSLLPDTTYWYRCVASNSYDFYYWSEPTSFKTPAAGGVTRIWTGYSTNALASNTNNWQGAVLPTALDYVLLDGSPSNLTWDAGVNGLPNTVARWTQTERYIGTSTFYTTYASYNTAFTNFTVTGDVIMNNGYWTHQGHINPQNNDGARRYRLSVSIGGDLTLGALAKIDVFGRGLVNDNINESIRGTLGGQRSYESGSLPLLNRTTRGSITAPEDVGRGGDWTGVNARYGGGAIWLTVGGASAIEGEILARAGTWNNPTYTPRHGSGGSIRLQTGRLSGNGLIDSSNGDAGAYGGGGRVAVIVTNDTSFGAIRMQAFGGGSGPGAAGTIYKQHSGHAANGGILLLDNNNQNSGYYTQPYYTYGVTLMPDSANGGPVNLNQFTEVVLTNRAILGINTDTVCNWSNVNWRVHNRDRSFIAIRGFNGITWPTNLVINGYTLLIDTNLTAPCNWTVTADGRVSATFARQSANSGTTVGYPLVQPLTFTVNGNLAVDAGGEITVQRMGYSSDTGLGRQALGRASSHGGQGGCTNASISGVCYGSILFPATSGSGGAWGSPNFSPGGGRMRLTVTGSTTLNGTLDARPHLADNLLEAGGSIWLTTGTLSGNGSILAYGRDGSGGSAGGGGGRIAVYLTQGNDVGSVTLDARGGGVSLPGAAGPVYLQTASQTAGGGEIRIWNNGRSTTNAATLIPADGGALVSDLPPVYGAHTEDLTRTFLRLTDQGRVRLTTHMTVGNLEVSTNSYLVTGTNKLYVDSREHHLAYPGILGQGIISMVDNYANIIWTGGAPGTIILIK